MSLVYPVAVLTATFCMTSSFCMFVSDARGDHEVEACLLETRSHGHQCPKGSLSAYSMSLCLLFL